MTRIIFLIIIAILAVLFFLPAEPISAPKNVLPAIAPAPQIEAKAALAQNLLAGEVLFSKNADEILPLASLTKIVTLLTIFDKLEWNEEVEISRAAVLIPEPSTLRVGERLLARDLAAMVMVESSNDAVFALFEHANLNQDLFLNFMREKAEAFGAVSMNFNNITGLDETSSISGGYGSAKDMMKIAKAALDSKIWQLGIVREIISREGVRHALKPTNDLAPELSPLLGSKTGYTDLAGGNLLVIVEYPIGHPLGIVVLGSSEKGRFEDVKKILEWVKTR